MLNKFEYMTQRPYIVPVPRKSLHCHQYKLDINTPGQKSETICVKILQKKKQKEKRNIQGISCLCGATFIVNPNPLHPSCLNLRLVTKGQVPKSRLSKDLLKETYSFSTASCFYFKRKCWEVNVAMEVVAHTERCFLNMKVTEGGCLMSCECSTGKFYIDFSVISEGVLQFDKFDRILSLWDTFYLEYLHFGRCVKGKKMPYFFKRKI